MRTENIRRRGKQVETERNKKWSKDRIKDGENDTEQNTEIATKKNKIKITYK